MDNKELIAAEYKKCAIDPIYFMKKYCYIQHRTRGRILFALYKFQEKVLSEFKKYPYNIILKSRQLGISTLTAAYALWIMIFNSDKNIIVIATTQDVAKNLVDIVRFMYDNLPSWLKVQASELNKLNIKLVNGSQIKAKSSATNTARSEATSLLIIDEAAFVSDIAEVWGASQQTLACLSENSIIFTEKGLFRFESLRNNLYSAGFNEHKINIINKFGNSEASNAFYISDLSECLEILFEDGNSIIVTKNNPLLVDNLWVQAKDLKIGEKVFCRYNTNVFGKKIKYPKFKQYRNNDKKLSSFVSNEDLSYFIGMWIAEGYFGDKKSKSPPIGICNAEPEIIEWLNKKFGFKNTDGKHNYVSFAQLYKILNWMGCKRGAHNKCIPDRILHASKKEQIAFLRGLFDGDGCATQVGSIKYTSVSKQLVLDIYSLLLNFGIRTHIKYIDNTEKKSTSTVVKNKQYRYKGYDLLIYGKNARKFFEIIGFNLQRKQCRFKKYSNDGNLINIESDTIRKMIKKSGYSLTYFNKNIVNVSRILWFNSKNITQYAANKILIHCNKNLEEYNILKNKILDLENSFFNKIVSIKDAGEKITYDLKVPGTNSFISNGIITHNTGGNCIILSCVTKDTYVLTNRGFLQVKDFIPNCGIIGDYAIPSYKIYGKNGMQKGNLFHNNGIVKTKIIKTKFSELECSFNHKFLAYTESDLKYTWPIEASNLNVGDYISIKNNMQIFGNDDLIRALYSKSKKIKNPIDHIIITKELAYLFGLYISEGNARFIKNKHGVSVGGSLDISCGDDISWVFDKLNLNYTCYDDLHYNVSSKNLIELFESVGFDLYKKAHDKEIPNNLLKMSKENIIWMLRGMFDGDGCSYKQSISYVSTSSKLSLQIRMLLLNFGIMCSKFIQTKELKNSYKNPIKFNYDSHILEIYGKNALKFYNIIGFNLQRKQKNILNLKSSNFNRSTPNDVIPNTLDLVKKLYSLSEETTYSLHKNFGLNINGILNKSNKYKTRNISREIVIKMFDLFGQLLDTETYNYWNDLISPDIVWVKIKEISESKNETFDFSLRENKSDKWCHSVLYNGIIGHQTPNGSGNWYHKTWIDAIAGKNRFNTIHLHWSMHPERDQAWRDQQTELLGLHLASQECDADFLTSGKSVISGTTLEWYMQTYIKDPIEKRMSDLWIWERPDYNKQYIVCLPTGEHVLTSLGLKKVEDVNYEDSLIDKNGIFTTIKDIKIRQYFGDVFEFTVSNTFRKTKFTDEHPIWSSSSSKLERLWGKRDNRDFGRRFWKHKLLFQNAKNVKKGDWLEVPNIYIKENRDFINKKWNELENISRIDFKIKENPLHSKEFWWYVGMWLAEGWTYEDINGCMTVYTAHNINENSYVERICDICKNILSRKVIITKYQMSNCMRCQFNSKQIAMFLKNNFGSGAKNKKIPEWVKYIPFEFKKELVLGYIAGDGCILEKGNKKTTRITSSSLELLEGMQDILFSLGIVSRVGLLRKAGGISCIRGKEFISGQAFDLSIHDFGTSILFGEKSIAKTQRISDCYLSDDNKFIYFRIKNVKKYKYDGLVHNFTTDSGTFLCENIATHNCADVARGDGADDSAFHVLELETLTQVAEYVGAIDTNDYGNLLVAVATEYNDAILVIENNGLGWAPIQKVIDRGYKNLFYTTIDLKYLDPDKQFTNKLYSREKKAVAGFYTGVKSRPLIIAKLESYFETQKVEDRPIIRSERLINELRTFVWNGNKAEAMHGYNDDLSLALAIGLWVRDTALQLNLQNINLNKAILGSIISTLPAYNQSYTSSMNIPPGIMTAQDTAETSWNMTLPHGEIEDLKNWI